MALVGWTLNTLASVDNSKRAAKARANVSVYPKGIGLSLSSTACQCFIRFRIRMPLRTLGTMVLGRWEVPRESRTYPAALLAMRPHDAGCTG